MWLCKAVQGSVCPCVFKSLWLYASLIDWCVAGGGFQSGCGICSVLCTHVYYCGVGWCHVLILRVQSASTYTCLCAWLKRRAGSRVLACSQESSNCKAAASGSVSAAAACVSVGMAAPLHSSKPVPSASMVTAKKRTIAWVVCYINLWLHRLGLLALRFESGCSIDCVFLLVQLPQPLYLLLLSAVGALCAV